MNKNNNIGLYINKTPFQGMGDTLGALEKIEIKKIAGGGAVGWSVRLACGRLGFRIPATTDPSR